ncbi:Hypothetical protein ETEE_1218 [Edwardsiella anguillarum ET080813]|uniref:Uncharacterized protein n=1 Tax=Edwardsiella anguillarum ET080813 TaxID=667120 RepID=A0A076LLR0_9GAMM|nr:Hypothetical protein ETEE_1218 [Edwardsiella anguillarum ET080813]
MFFLVFYITSTQFCRSKDRVIVFFQHKRSFILKKVTFV